MQIKALSAFADDVQSITGISGTSYVYTNITFNPADYTFTYNGGSGTVDITDDIKRADALTFPAFDPTVANNWASYRAGRTTVVNKAGINPGDELNTNVLDLTAQNIGAQVSNIGSSITSGLVKPVLYVVGAYFLIKLLTSRK